MQNHYSLIYREEEREMMPTLKVDSQSTIVVARAHRDFSQLTGAGAIPWSPLGRGLLTRPFGQKGSSTRSTNDTMHKGYGPATEAIVKR
jgi:aryl-alcohol dehydrogenase-like predicted oxidoreductase